MKWHLFEAKKELKRGMEKVRESSQLKFNPIRFDQVGIIGSAGDQPIFEYLRSLLSQNLCYDVRNEAKSAAEIADDLGVSPVYVEEEAQRLEEFGLLTRQKEKYLVNFLIAEQKRDFLLLQDETYRKAASSFANALYGELLSDGVLEDPALICLQSDDPIALSASPRADRNFIQWSVIPYVTACSERTRTGDGDSKEEVATIRPDGGRNIVYATVTEERRDPPRRIPWCGPSEFGRDGYAVWRYDSEWSDKRITVDDRYFETMMRVLGDYAAELKGPLSKEEYVWLSELGFVKTNGDYDGHFKSGWQTVILADSGIRKRLLAVGARVREQFKPETEAYLRAALDTVPAHLRKVKAYELQNRFGTDGPSAAR